MEHGFSILMLFFAGAILLYAAILGITKDITLIRRYYVVDVENKEAYAVCFAKIMALMSLAPLLGGLVGFFNQMAGLLVLLVGMIVGLYLATQIIKKVM